MAEGGMIESIVGGGDEARESEAVAADAAAIAIAMDEAGKHPAVAADASAFLQAQRRLVDLQVKHFDAERHVALQTARLRRTSDRIKLGLLGATAAVVVAVVAGLAAMVWSAAHDHGVAIAAFAVPPDLAQRGLTGRTVAGLIQDKLASLDAQSVSNRPARSYANDWGGDIKVEIPETGVSIGEASRLLHDALGHSTHIDGEVFRGPAGLTVVAHVDGSATTVTGPEADFDKLIDRAAEGVYARTQPYRYGAWLFLHDRVPESLTILRRLADGDDPEDRFWALTGLSHHPDARQARLAALQAVAMSPTSEPLVVLAAAESRLGHDEAELAAWRRSGTAPDFPGISAASNENFRLSAQIGIASELGDFASEIAAAKTRQHRAAVGSSRAQGVKIALYADIRRHHQLAAADEAAAKAIEDEAQTRAVLVALRVAEAQVRGDWAVIAHFDEAAVKDWRAEMADDVYVDLTRAEAYAHVGRDAEADALLRAVADDNYDGWLTRGRVAAFRRDWPGAARDFAEAVRQGPSLPRGYKDWGDLLAAKGDLAGAVAKYGEAKRRGPKWADPLKAWGDVLIRQGQRAAALAKYDAALAHAPEWTDLNEARDRLRRGGVGGAMRAI